MLAIGLGLAGWGLMGISWWGGNAPGPVGQDNYWRAAVFMRMFGSALAAFGLAALAMWRVREPEWHRAACPFFFLAHAILFGIAWAQQTAIWGTMAGAVVVDLFVLLQAAYGYYWLMGMRQPGFPYPQSVPQLRQEWETRIREAAGQQERNRLARELHDSIKQQIYAIQTFLAAAQTQSPVREDPIDLARNAARQAVEEMNALLEQLKASPLETVGLVEALRHQCEALGHRTGAQVNAIFGALPRDRELTPGMQTEIFRIAQEALSNVARHARASNVTLELGPSPPHHLRLSVRDDGQGFRTGQETHGMGLRNMRSRAAAIGASLSIENAEGGGTTVMLRVPLMRPEVEQYCRHMRVAGGASAFTFGMFGLALGLREAAYALPATLGAAATLYHLREYVRWKRRANEAQA